MTQFYQRRLQPSLHHGEFIAVLKPPMLPVAFFGTYFQKSIEAEVTPGCQKKKRPQNVCNGG